MKSLTIEDISHNTLSIRLINTSHIYKINLGKIVKFSDIQGLEKDELLLVGIVAGKISRDNKNLLCQYDFENLVIAGDFRIKNINFGRDVTFIKNDTSLITITYSDMLSNLDIINNIPDELSFYMGFLYGVFSLSDDGIILGDHPKPYLTVKYRN